MTNDVLQCIQYPLMAYSGPRLSQVVLCNLADTTCPQKLVQLPENEQLVSFIGNNSCDEIHMLTFTAEDEMLNWRVIMVERPF